MYHPNNTAGVGGSGKVAHATAAVYSFWGNKKHVPYNKKSRRQLAQSAELQGTSPDPSLRSLSLSLSVATGPSQEKC